MGWNYLSIPKLQHCHRWYLGMDKYFQPTLYWTYDYLFMLALKLIHVSKSGPTRRHGSVTSPKHQWYWTCNSESISFDYVGISSFVMGNARLHLITTIVSSTNTRRFAKTSYEVLHGRDEDWININFTLSFMRQFFEKDFYLLHKSILLIAHDDVIKWKHFSRYWTFVRGIPRSPVNSPHKGQWRRALMFSLICAWING